VWLHSSIGNILLSAELGLPAQLCNLGLATIAKIKSCSETDEFFLHLQLAKLSKNLFACSNIMVTVVSFASTFPSIGSNVKLLSR